MKLTMFTFTHISSVITVFYPETITFKIRKTKNKDYQSQTWVVGLTI